MGREVFFKYLAVLLLCLFDAAADGKLKVGVILPLTGPLANVGESVRNSVTLADKNLDVNDEVDFIFDDDQFQAKSAITSATKLISEDHVNALVTFGGGSSTAVAEVAARKKIPLICITSLTTVGRGKPSVFTLLISDEQQVRVLSAEIEKRQLKRVVVITTVQEAMMGVRRALTARLQPVVVLDEEVLPGDTGLSSIVAKATAAKPDAVVLLTLPPQLSVLSRQLREQGFKGQFFGGLPLFNPAEIKASSGALIGAILPGPATSGAATFLAQYENEFHLPFISEGFYGYEAAALLIDALRTDNPTSALTQKTSFDGLVGKIVQQNERFFEVAAVLKIVTPEVSLKQVE